MVSINKLGKILNRNSFRKVELNYARPGEAGKIKLIKDFDRSGKNHYEIKIGEGRIFTETFKCKEGNLITMMSNLKAQREIIGEPEKIDLGDGNYILRIKTRIADVVSEYKTSIGEKDFSEKVTTAPIFQPPSWITEDMMSTYFHYLTGWDTEINPEGIGHAVGPSDFMDVAKQHHRWFKGGPECYLDMKKYLDAYPALKHSMQGYFMQQAYLWPMHTITDLALYVIPPAFFAGQYMFQNGIIPLSTPWLYIPVFTAYFFSTLAMYKRVMSSMGNGISEVWRKEALLSMMGPVYTDAFKKAVMHEPLEFAETAAGDRKMLSYDFLRGIKWRRDVSKVTMGTGIVFTAGITSFLGGDVPGLTYAGLAFNTLFPALRWALLKGGIHDLYSYHTSFDTYIKENLDIEGAGNIKVSEDTNDTRSVSFKVDSRKAAVKAMRRLSGDLKFTNKVKNFLVGKPGTAGFADIESRTMTPDNANNPKGPQTVTLVVKVKEGGMYKSFEVNSRVDGNFYFKHDYKIQKKYNNLDNKLLSAVKKGHLEKALNIYDEIVAEKKRDSAVIMGDAKSYKLKMTKDENELIGWVVEDLTKKIEKDKDPQTVFKDQMLLSRALITSGKPADAAAVLLGMVSKGETANRGEVVQKLRQTILLDPASMNKVVLSMKEEEITEVFASKGPVFNGVVSEDIADITSNMTMEDEGVFMGSLSGCGSLRDALIVDFYGLTAESYDQLIVLNKQFQVNEQAIRDILDNETLKKTDNIMIRIIGPDNAKRLMTGGKI